MVVFLLTTHLGTPMFASRIMMLISKILMVRISKISIIIFLISLLFGCAPGISISATNTSIRYAHKTNTPVHPVAVLSRQVDSQRNPTINKSQDAVDVLQRLKEE